MIKVRIQAKSLKAEKPSGFLLKRIFFGNEKNTKTL